MPNNLSRFEIIEDLSDLNIKFYSYGELLAIVNEVTSGRFSYGECHYMGDSNYNNAFGFTNSKEIALHIITIALANIGFKEAIEINIEDYCYD